MRGGLPACAVAAVLGLPLAGCAPEPHRPPTIAISTYQGAPSGLPAPTGPALPAVLAVQQPGDRLALTLWGSGSCPTVPVGTEVVSRHEVRVTLDRYGGACTADFAPTTSVIQLDGTRVDTTAALTVALTGVAGLPATVTARPAPP